MPEVLKTEIDLSECEHLSLNYLQATILPSLLSCGAIYLYGHGISEAKISQSLQTCKVIHELPESEKLELDVSHSRGARGYFGARDITFPKTARPDANPMVIQRRSYSSFEIGNEKKQPQHLEDEILFAHNVWPANPELRSMAESYVKYMLVLADSVQRFFVRILQLPIDYFLERTRHPVYHLRLIAYTAETESVRLGLGAHTDYECFTLAVESVSGLQVMNRLGTWLSVPPRKGAIVFLAGDLMEVITGGEIESVLHRVTSAKSRYSCVFFMGLDPGVKLSPAKKPGREDLHLRVGDHLLARTLENFPHLRSKVEQGDIKPPIGFGRGNPFKVRKLRNYPAF